MSEREIRVRMGTNGRISMELVDPRTQQCLEARTELWSAGEIPAVGQEVTALLMEDAERLFPNVKGEGSGVKGEEIPVRLTRARLTRGKRDG
jgi:hypothetical protein